MERQSKSLLIKYLNEVINIIPESVGDVSNELLNQSNNYFYCIDITMRQLIL
jgi:hypothetical protein